MTGRSFIALLLVACSADPGYQGRSSDDWIKQLHDSSPKRRVDAADALGKILRINPDAHDVVDALSAALTDTSDELRLAAATALTTEGVSPLGALSGFHAMLHDSAHAQVRASMAFLIGTLGSARGRMLIPALSESLSDPDPGVRAAAAESLGMLGSARVNEVEAIAKLARDTSPAVRKAAIQTLLNLRAAPATILTVTRPALSDSVAAVRAAAAYALWPLAAQAAPAVPELVIALNDPEPEVRVAAAFALGGIGPAARRATRTLQRLLADSATRVVTQAAEALASIEGGAQQRAIPGEPSATERCPPGSRAPRC